MLICDSKFEVEFRDNAVPELAQLGVEVVAARHLEQTNVLSVVVRLPPSADRVLRHRALDVLADFEHRFDSAIITDPTFVWGDEDD